MKRRENGSEGQGVRQTRREFLKTAARLGLGGALGWLGLSLITGRKSAGAAASCSSNFYCRACSRTAACPLPQALSFRKKFGG